LLAADEAANAARSAIDTRLVNRRHPPVAARTISVASPVIMQRYLLLGGAILFFFQDGIGKLRSIVTIVLIAATVLAALSRASARRRKQTLGPASIGQFELRIG
jgi:hypothetical protein